MIDSRTLGWVLLVPSSLLLAIGLLFGADLIAVLALGPLLAIVTLLAPETLLALFITIGGFKAAPWLTFLPVDATVLAAIAVIVVIFARAWRRGVPPLPPIALAPIALAAIVTLSVLWSPTPGDGFDKAVKFIFLTLLAMLAAFVLIRDRSDFLRLMIGLVGFGLLIALTAQATGNPNKPLTVVGGGLTNQIELALYSAIGLLAAIYLTLRGPWQSRVLGGVAIPILSFTIFAAASRGILVGTLVALIYLGFVLSKGHTGRIATAFIALVLTLGVAVSLTVETDSVSRYQNTLLSGSSDQVLGLRAYIYETAAQTAEEHPFGIGSAGYPSQTGGLVYPHNIELELAAEYGYLAVALFLVLIIGSWRARKRAMATSLRIESSIVGAMMIVLFLDAQVSHDLNGSRPLWLVLGLSVGLLGGRVHLSRAAPTPMAVQPAS